MNEQVREQVLSEARALFPKMRERRRDFHKYAETGWTEFRTGAIVADTLFSLGYDVLTGDQVFDEATMMGLPDAATLAKHQERAISEGANPKWVEKMTGGKTGVVGILEGAKPGPIVAFRFDMDANDLTESQDADHRPVVEGFVSIHPGASHSCGHDGHTAIGLAVAEILAAHRHELAGTIKLIFQPAEEGVRGAKSMMIAGVVDDVDYFVGAHLGFMVKENQAFSSQVSGFLATTKLDANFKGRPAHAGGAPEEGRNALLAAATAALNLHGIARHSGGATRMNVGQLIAGSGRNVVPAEAVLKLETRGGTTELDEYMAKRARQIILAAAQMHECEVEILPMGGAACSVNHPELAKTLEEVAKTSGIFKNIVGGCDLGGSEDCAYFIERVNNRGGQAAYVAIGSEIAAGHHDGRFDFEENSMENGVAMFSLTALTLLG